MQEGQVEPLQELGFEHGWHQCHSRTRRPIHQCSPRQWLGHRSHSLSDSALSPTSPHVSTPPSCLHIEISAQHTSDPVPLQLRRPSAFHCCLTEGGRTPLLKHQAPFCLASAHPIPSLALTLPAHLPHYHSSPCSSDTPCMHLPQVLFTCCFFHLELSSLDVVDSSLIFGSCRTPPPLWPAKVRPFCPLLCVLRELFPHVFICGTISLSLTAGRELLEDRGGVCSTHSWSHLQAELRARHSPACQRNE